MRSKKNTIARGAGVLLAISSLPSPYGIGTLGKESKAFVDWLYQAGQKYWQILPTGPIGFGDSPYQTISAFAGNPYFIDLDQLIEERLLTKEDVNQQQSEDDRKVPYALLFQQRYRILRLAFHRGKGQLGEGYQIFCEENAEWLTDYAFFMAWKEHMSFASWDTWPEKIRCKEQEAVQEQQKRLQEEMEFWKFCQYQFHKQWKELKQYANEKGIQLIGDIPFYLAYDSVDVWANRKQFLLEPDGTMAYTAGVPADDFATTGQRWGNPLYDWEYMKQDSFSWWEKRLRKMAQLYDVIRLDHFIGLAKYYQIPVEEETALHGKWNKGPADDILPIIEQALGETKMIVEDLGDMTPDVQALLEKSGYPGMKVIQFAFDGNPYNPYLPHNYQDSHTIVYTGTHDNATLIEFLEGLNPMQREYICNYFQAESLKELPDKIQAALYASPADLIILPMQDILKLDQQARMNIPSTQGENWRWRVSKEELQQADTERLARLAKLYGRI